MWMVRTLPVAIVVSISLCKAEIKPFPDTLLSSFTKPFRKRVLETVATEYKGLVADGKKLKVDADICLAKLKASVDKCKACAKSACQRDFSQFLRHHLDYVNPAKYLKDPADKVAGRVQQAIDILKEGGSKFINIIKGVVPINTAKSTVNKAVNTVKNIFRRIPNPFGRRRRSTADPETRQCMEKCASCQPFLQNRDRMIKSVCGDSFANANATFYSRLTRATEILKVAVDKVTPVLQKIEYEENSFRFFPGLRYGTIYVTARFSGNYGRYQSQHPFFISDIATTAQNVADEYLAKWK